MCLEQTMCSYFSVLRMLVKADGHDATYDTRMDSVLWQAVFKKIDESPLH